MSINSDGYNRIKIDVEDECDGFEEYLRVQLYKENFVSPLNEDKKQPYIIALHEEEVDDLIKALKFFKDN